MKKGWFVKDVPFKTFIPFHFPSVLEVSFCFMPSRDLFHLISSAMTVSGARVALLPCELGQLSCTQNLVLMVFVTECPS